MRRARSWLWDQAAPVLASFYVFALAGEARAAPAGLSVEESLTLASDYRYRGQSLSNGHPALQGEIDVATSSGPYGGIWASTIRPTAGAHVEVDLTAGEQIALPAHLLLDVAVTRFWYPGARGQDYWQFPIAFSRKAGAGRWQAGFEYAPPQAAIGGRADSYVYLQYERRLPHGAQLLGAVGREDGSMGSDKLDWRIQGSLDAADARFSVAYVGFHAVRFGGALVFALNMRW